VERFEITNAGLNFEDNVVDIFITLIFKRWAEEIEIETQSRDI
jgi:hypothetical protein